MTDIVKPDVWALQADTAYLDRAQVAWETWQPP